VEQLITSSDAGEKKLAAGRDNAHRRRQH
jgi:hypothetical protein